MCIIHGLNAGDCSLFNQELSDELLEQNKFPLLSGISESFQSLDCIRRELDVEELLRRDSNLSVFKTFFVLLIIIFLIAGCSSVPSQTAISKPISKQILYEACMLSETQDFKGKAESNPELIAHYFCQGVAGVCEKEPKKDWCQKPLRKYELELNKQGKSLLYQAAYIGDYRLVEAIVKAGANVNYSLPSNFSTQFGVGWTPLMIAVAEGNTEVVTTLIKSGANVNAKNQLGRTSLMFSSKYGFYSITKILLEHGANTDDIPNDKEGWTAMIAAAYEGHNDIVNLLLSHGADKNIQDKNGKTALMWAEERGNTRVTEILKGFR